MRKKSIWILKVIISGMIAFGVMTGFCMFYYNVPVHSQNKDGATDYSWEANKFYSRATEGFAFGKTNNEGYINDVDYNNQDSIDILIMGSSHMEAFQVVKSESTSGLLNSLLPEYKIYNIGISGHDFLVCADNFSAAINKYKPKKYIVLETSNLFFTDEQLIDAINENVAEISSHSSGIIGMLQKNQFLRLSYTQLSSIYNNSKQNDELTPVKKRGKEENYIELIRKLSDTSSEIDAKLIIFYHPSLRIHENGNVSIDADEELVSFFSKNCFENGVIFLDMSNPFIKEYKKKNVLPHGFINSSVGSGHLNKHGHKIIAESLYNIIKEEK